MLASRQLTVSSICRDAWVEVDLERIERNVSTILSWIDRSKTGLVAVVKADGYGHGATRVAECALSAGASWLAVATVDEGVTLRNELPESAKTTPILILGPVPTSALATAAEHKLDLTVCSQIEIDALTEFAREMQKTIRVHLKLDTGMHRLGAHPKDIVSLVQAISASKQLQLTSIFSHLACADQRDFTKKQDALFCQALETLAQAFPRLLRSQGGSVFTHIASGDAARLHDFTHHDMIRVGLNLYGLQSRTASDTLKPALAVRAKINSLREISENEAIGYNLTWHSRGKAVIASIPIGYADGVDRALSNQMEGLLHGKRIKQAGLISMDQMLFDVTAVPEAARGDTVTLIGQDQSESIELADWANLLDTITYELACRLRLRLPRIYTHE